MRQGTIDLTRAGQVWMDNLDPNGSAVGGVVDHEDIAESLGPNTSIARTARQKQVCRKRLAVAIRDLQIPIGHGFILAGMPSR